MLKKGIMAAKELTVVVVADAGMATTIAEESTDIDATKKDEAGEEKLALMLAAAIMEGSIDGGNLAGSSATKEEEINLHQVRQKRNQQLQRKKK
jgi:hypothetical protein